MPAAGLPQLRPPLRPAPPPAEVQSPSSPPTVARGRGASQGSRALPAIWATCPPTWAALGCWLLGALHVPPLPTYHPQALPLLLQALPFNPPPARGHLRMSPPGPHCHFLSSPMGQTGLPSPGPNAARPSPLPGTQ